MSSAPGHADLSCSPLVSCADKPQFPCDMQALDERWLTGHQQCWQHKMESAQACFGKEDAEAAAE